MRVGGISGIANAFPELISSLYARKDPQKPDNNGKVRNIIAAIKKYPSFPAIKCCVELQKGTDWHAVRPPITPLTSTQRQALSQELDSIHFALVR